MQPSQPQFEYTTVFRDAIAAATEKMGPAEAGYKEGLATMQPSGRYHACQLP
jgi:hypothetical protein